MPCLYYLAVVKYNKKDEYIRAKLEPFLHGLSIMVSLVGAIIVLAKEAFNAHVMSCWIERDAPYCGRGAVGGVEILIPCRRGADAKTIISIVAAGPYIIICVIATTMLLVYLEVRKNETKLSKYGVGALRANLNSNIVRNGNSESGGQTVITTMKSVS